jgi:hypothetical protein
MLETEAPGWRISQKSLIDAGFSILKGPRKVAGSAKFYGETNRFPHLGPLRRRGPFVGGSPQPCGRGTAYFQVGLFVENLSKAYLPSKDLACDTMFAEVIPKCSYS